MGRYCVTPPEFRKSLQLISVRRKFDLEITSKANQFLNKLDFELTKVYMFTLSLTSYPKANSHFEI